jgi:hypothetical protein
MIGYYRPNATPLPACGAAFQLQRHRDNAGVGRIRRRTKAELGAHRQHRGVVPQDLTFDPANALGARVSAPTPSGRVGWQGADGSQPAVQPGQPQCARRPR